MTNVIDNLAAIMRAELNTLDSVAQNSANVNTNGYRAMKSARIGTSFENTLSIMGENRIPYRTVVDQRDGPAASTGNPFDLSVFGDGWFSISHPSGVKLSRDGHFHVNNEGVLVNRHGYPVLGVSGEITGFDELARLDARGEITFSDGSKEQLQLLSVKDATTLVALGNGLYESKQYIEAHSYKLMQGSLESSNVDIAADMVSLMRTTRHIETLQRAMSSYDQILDIGINQLGK